MKKKPITLALSNLTSAKRAILNSFTEEGAKAADAVVAALEEIENSEVEVDAEALVDYLAEAIKKVTKVDINEEVANQLAKNLQTLQNSINKELSPKVKNEVAAAILGAHGREEVRNAVEAVAIKNGVTGLTFEEIVDYSIVDGWGDSNRLFAALKETPFTKFFYTEQELSDARVLAKQWDSANASNIEKAIQEIEATGKTISPEYIYKRQNVSRKDLVRIEKAGGMSNFLSWLNAELDRQIVNTIMMAVLVGDTTNAQGARVTSFETIATKTQSDVFTTVVNPESEGDVVVADVRRMCDAVKNPFGKKKWLVCSPSFLTSISAFVYGAGGTTDFRSLDVMAGVLGVDEIFATDLINEQTGTYAVCMIPEGYWYVQEDYLAVTYPTYEKNVTNYLKERNIGGAIHDLYSTAVLKLAE